MVCARERGARQCWAGARACALQGGRGVLGQLAGCVLARARAPPPLPTPLPPSPASSTPPGTRPWSCWSAPCEPTQPAGEQSQRRRRRQRLRVGVGVFAGGWVWVWVWGAGAQGLAGGGREGTQGRQGGGAHTARCPKNQASKQRGQARKGEGLTWLDAVHLHHRRGHEVDAGERGCVDKLGVGHVGAVHPLLCRQAHKGGAQVEALEVGWVGRAPKGPRIGHRATTGRAPLACTAHARSPPTHPPSGSCPARAGAAP